MFLDPIYTIYIIPGLILSIIASIWIQLAYSRNSKRNTNNPPALEIANEIVEKEGYPVDIISQGEPLTDYYDPKKEIVKLSKKAPTSNSIGDIAVSLHELGHVQQKHERNILFRIRTSLVPIVNIGSQLGYILFLIGFLLNILQLSEIGLILFALTTVFALLTVPIEIDASIKAMKFINKYNLLTNKEKRGARNVLIGAAMTYIASLLTSLLNLLYYVNLLNRRRN